MAINYEGFVGGDGSITIPEGIPSEERLDLLRLGAGQVLQNYGRNGKALRTIQKKINEAEVALEVERLEMLSNDEEVYEEAETKAIEIIDHLFNPCSSPKYVPSSK